MFLAPIFLVLRLVLGFFVLLVGLMLPRLAAAFASNVSISAASVPEARHVAEGLLKGPVCAHIATDEL